MIEGWSRVSVADIGKVVSGGTPDSKNPAYWDGDIPWATPTDITSLTSRYISSTARQITEAGLKSSSARLVPAGSILICTRATIGELAIASEPICTNQGFKNLVTTPEYDNEFIFYLLQFFKNDLIRYASGSTFRELTKRDFKKLTFVVPPLLEQRRIAKILSTWDQSIETVEKLIANSQVQKRALMLQLLNGKYRLHGFNDEWKAVSLNDLLASEKTKGNIVPCNNERIGIPYIGSASFFGEFSSYTKSSTAILCKPSDILILWDGEYAGKVTIGLQGAVSSTVVRLRIDRKIGNNRFVFYRILFDNTRIRSIREGSGIPHLPGDFESWYRFLLPCLREQSKIVDRLDNASEQENVLIRQVKLLRKEKETLMRQLLTGKRRVKTEEANHA